MAYKSSGSLKILDDQTVVFDNITVKNYHTLFKGLGGEASHGYISGGLPPFSYSNVIEKFSFPSDANATDVGDLTERKYGASGQSSSAHGYTSGGTLKSPPAPAGQTNVIEKWSFSSDGNASDVGDLLNINTQGTGQSSDVNGYHSGGYVAASTPPYTNVIQKWPFSSDTNSTDAADLTQGRGSIPGGQSSGTDGYTSGGLAYGPGPFGDQYFYSTIVDKFPFSSDANATDVGDITQGKYYIAGQSSSSHGYSSCGFGPPVPARSNVIDKFPFASNANATDVGDATVAKDGPGGSSSGISGYIAGGSLPPDTNVIEKFPFASDANAADVADLTVSQRRRTGTQG